MKRYWLAISIVTLILGMATIPRVFLVPRLIQGLEDELSESLYAKQVQISVQAPLGWELLLGRIPGLDIVAAGAVVDGLGVARVEVHGDQVRFDTQALWQDQEFVFVEAANLWGEITVTEGALNELFWKEVDPERSLSLRVSPQGIGVEGKISVWNMEFTITLRGDLEVLHGSALRFVLKNLEVQETRIPPILLELLSEEFNFAIDFGAFPYPVELTEVQLAEQQIKVLFGGLQ